MASLHPSLKRSADHLERLEAAMRSLRRAQLQVAVAAPNANYVEIPLTTVSLNGNFDSYVNIAFSGASSVAVKLLVDSGNSTLIVPRWEDIAALPNWEKDYKVLGEATEPWGCPARVVQGPITFQAVGETYTIDCPFYACTADSPTEGRRTANFGTGCLTPWTASNNTPKNIKVTMQAPLSYRRDYPYAGFRYAPARDVYARSICYS